MTQLSEIFARQAQGWSVPGCVPQRGWTPSRFAGFFANGSPNVGFGGPGPCWWLQLKSSWLQRPETSSDFQRFNWSRCEAFPPTKKQRILRVWRVHSHYINWNLQMLRMTENSWSSRKNLSKTFKTLTGYGLNWVFTNSSILHIQVFHCKIFQDSSSSVNSSRLGLAHSPFSIDWILADSHPATSCCALQEAKRVLGLPTIRVSQVLHKKQHANAPSMLRKCWWKFSPGSRIKYRWQVFLPPGATPPKCGKRDTWTALHGLCIWHRTPTKKWRAIYWFE